MVEPPATSREDYEEPGGGPTFERSVAGLAELFETGCLGTGQPNAAEDSVGHSAVQDLSQDQNGAGAGALHNSLQRADQNQGKDPGDAHHRHADARHGPK